MAHAFKTFAPFRGAVRMRNQGVILSMNRGEAVAYALWQLEDRGQFIIPPGTRVYEGMIVGLCNKDRDLVVNTLRKKQLTNVRSSGHDDAIRLTPYIQLSLEQSLELIEGDELVEVTPRSVRLRKKILDQSARESWEKRKKNPAAG
jgi:GTP-binding protein